MGVALVHDYLLIRRGAERTFATIAECWRDAPIFTTLYSELNTDPCFADRQIRTSYLQTLRLQQHNFRWALPLYPTAVERLPVKGHRLVISSSSAFAHGVLTDTDAVHVCYCHVPFRYLRQERDRVLGMLPRWSRPPARGLLERLREWDERAASRVTRFIANSEFTRALIAEAYDRDAAVIYPPVEVDRFRLDDPEDYFLLVVPLLSHKRPDVALAAAERAGVRIKVVGVGPERKRLQQRFRKGAEFLGHVSDDTLADLYARTRALVIPNVEEFGIAGVECQAAGRPVLAWSAGGARETVIPGISGVLVPHGTVEEFAETMAEVDFDAFPAELIRAHARRFSAERFRHELTAHVEGIRTNAASNHVAGRA